MHALNGNVDIGSALLNIAMAAAAEPSRHGMQLRSSSRDGGVQTQRVTRPKPPRRRDDPPEEQRARQVQHAHRTERKKAEAQERRRAAADGARGRDQMQCDAQQLDGGQERSSRLVSSGRR